MSFPFYHQLDAMDCGPTCLRRWRVLASKRRSDRRGSRQGWEHIYAREGGGDGVFLSKQVWANWKQMMRHTARRGWAAR